MKACKVKFDEFDTYTFVGAISYDGNSKDTFYWMNSGKRINYVLDFEPGEPNNYDGKEFCLSISKHDSRFSFNDIGCTESTHQFICQKLK